MHRSSPSSIVIQGLSESDYYSCIYNSSSIIYTLTITPSLPHYIHLTKHILTNPPPPLPLLQLPHRLPMHIPIHINISNIPILIPPALRPQYNRRRAPKRHNNQIVRRHIPRPHAHEPVLRDAETPPHHPVPEMVLQELAPRVGLDEAGGGDAVGEPSVEHEVGEFLRDERGEDVQAEVAPVVVENVVLGDLAEAEGAAEALVLVGEGFVEHDGAPVQEGHEVVLRGAEGADGDAGGFDCVELDANDFEFASLVVEFVACVAAFGGVEAEGAAEARDLGDI